ncbi:hypothetical protein KAR91_85625 [Candidatus Pacearchaeota archaeon]|nr:hypothetical protein [Candidatus Pacearchaeota archaeon]
MSDKNPIVTVGGMVVELTPNNYTHCDPKQNMNHHVRFLVKADSLAPSMKTPKTCYVCKRTIPNPNADNDVVYFQGEAKPGNIEDGKIVYDTTSNIKLVCSMCLLDVMSRQIYYLDDCQDSP